MQPLTIYVVYCILVALWSDMPCLACTFLHFGMHLYTWGSAVHSAARTHMQHPAVIIAGVCVCLVMQPLHEILLMHCICYPLWHSTVAACNAVTSCAVQLTSTVYAPTLCKPYSMLLRCSICVARAMPSA